MPRMVEPLRAVAQIILKLFLESYHSKRHSGQGNIFFGRTRY
jgi:hypothetical protein